MDETNSFDYKYKDLTGKIINAFYNVYNILGHGFSKEVYVNSMEIELSKNGIRNEKGALTRIYYDEVDVGSCTVDFRIEPGIILMVSGKKEIDMDDTMCLYNILKRTGFEVGLHFNFGYKAEFKRKENQ